MTVDWAALAFTIWVVVLAACFFAIAWAVDSQQK
jgi:hypothetical protein